MLPRRQHIIASGIVAAIAIWVCWLSYSQQPAAAYLFPRLIATVFVLLAIWTFAKACLGWSKVGEGISLQAFQYLLPGLLISLIYVFWAAKALGFYTALAINCLILLSIYDRFSLSDYRGWLRRILITLIFIVIMYGLFAKLLVVYTPKEILFAP